MTRDEERRMEVEALWDEAEEITNALRRIVAEARAEDVTWETVGTYFGISKQAAQQRFGRS